jgi:hypothetical protein
MLSIDRLRDDLPRTPVLVRVGLVGLIVAAIADMPAHLLTGHGGHPASIDVGDVLAHVGVLVSMTLVLVGVVADGIRTRRRLTRKGVE